VHVSGHASQEEQKLLLKLTQPQYFIPIHGELRHLHRHARTAQEMGWPAERIFVVENGYTLKFDAAGAEIGERVPGGYVFVDGAGVGDIGPAVLREREMLSEDGFIVIGLKIDSKTGLPAEEPEIVSRGFVYVPESSELIAEIGAAIPEILQRTARYLGRPATADLLRDGLKRVLYDRTHRRPIIVPVITEV